MFCITSKFLNNLPSCKFHKYKAILIVVGGGGGGGG